MVPTMRKLVHCFFRHSGRTGVDASNAWVWFIIRAAVRDSWDPLWNLLGGPLSGLVGYSLLFGVGNFVFMVFWLFRDLEDYVGRVWFFSLCFEMSDRSGLVHFCFCFPWTNPNFFWLI